MMERFEWFLIGTSGLFEIVLLLLLCQPINRSHIAVWLKCLLSGAILYHLGYFLRLIIAEERFGSARWVDQLAMVLLCSGLVWMPCSMMHSAYRLQKLGGQSLKPLPNSDWRYSLFYVPLLLIAPSAWNIWRDTSGEFLQAIAPVQPYYIAFVTTANIFSAWMFGREAIASEAPTRRQFFGAIGITLLVISSGTLLYTRIAIRSEWEHAGRVLLGVAPVVPSILFLWFTLRNRLLPVVFDQSIVFGGILLALLFLHRLIVTPLTLEWRKVLDIDFIVIEVVAVSLLIWCYLPLRRRVSESLRFLFSPQVFRIRDQTRRLSLAIAQQTTSDLSSRCEWFAEELRTSLQLTWVRLVLCEGVETVRFFTSTSAASKPVEGNHEAKGMSGVGVPSESLVHLLKHLESVRRPMERGEGGLRDQASIELLDAMETLECDVAFPLFYRGIKGAVLFGSREIFDRLADEQLASLSVLMEQFAVSSQHCQDELARRRAERQSVQKEKLSTLGMISGSLAHELRNPLSSIRTIAKLVGEELPDAGTHRGDLQLIVEEVDRLTHTLQRVLDFARPADANNCRAEPDRVVSRVLAIMAYFAKQNNVVMDIQLNAPGVVISADDLSLHEIFLNLIKNGIEASLAIPKAVVTVRSEVREGFYVIEFIDRGVGIAFDRLPKVFMPFETDKVDGTGLGLFIVSDRVRELHGSLDLDSKPGEGARFTIRFPQILSVVSEVGLPSDKGVLKDRKESSVANQPFVGKGRNEDTID